MQERRLTCNRPLARLALSGASTEGSAMQERKKNAYNQRVARNQRKVAREEEEKPGRLSFTCELSGGARKSKDSEDRVLIFLGLR